jgi:hypothetical protein
MTEAQHLAFVEVPLLVMLAGRRSMPNSVSTPSPIREPAARAGTTGLPIRA